MKRSLFGFFFVVLIGLFGSGSYKDGFHAEDYVSIAYGIRSDAAKKLQKEVQLDCIGTGGSMMDVVSLICMDFNYYHEVTLDQARALIVEGAEILLNAFNSSKRMRPYLKNYPFTIKNLEFVIYSLTEKGGDVSSDQIEYISVLNGIVTYSLPYPEKGGRPILHKESYAEALRIVNEEMALKNDSEEIVAKNR